MTRLQVRVLLLFGAAVVALATTAIALAHPLGNFTINRYARLDVYADAIQVHYVVDAAEIPAFQMLGDLDTNGDGAYSSGELDLYSRSQAESWKQQFALTVDGKKLDTTILEVKGQVLEGQGGLNILRLVAIYEAPLSGLSADQATLSFEDRNFADRVGWKEIVIRPSQGATLTVDPRFTDDTSDELRNYPAESLKSAPDERSGSATFVPGSGRTAPTSADIEPATSDRTGNCVISFAGAGSCLSNLISRDTTIASLFLSLIAAFGFGMLHALGPGHGKTVVAAYLVGSKGRVRHAIALGGTVTATHTAAVYLLGFIALIASENFATERVQLWLGIASGVAIVAWGGGLFIARLRSALRKDQGTADGLHRHGFFGAKHSHLPQTHDHQHDQSDNHSHADGPEHAHDHGEHHNHAHDDGRVTWRSIFTLGVIGGMLPCPSAVVVMLAAISIGRVAYGMLLIVAFSAGLAGVLMGIGVALVLGRRMSRGSRMVRAFDRPRFALVANALPVIGAFAVFLAGIGVTTIAINRPGI